MFFQTALPTLITLKGSFILMAHGATVEPRSSAVSQEVHRSSPKFTDTPKVNLLRSLCPNMTQHLAAARWGQSEGLVSTSWFIAFRCFQALFWMSIVGLGTRWALLLHLYSWDFLASLINLNQPPWSSLLGIMVVHRKFVLPENGLVKEYRLSKTWIVQLRFYFPAIFTDCTSMCFSLQLGLCEVPWIRFFQIWNFWNTAGASARFPGSLPSASFFASSLSWSAWRNTNYWPCKSWKCCWVLFWSLFSLFMPFCFSSKENSAKQNEETEISTALDIHWNQETPAQGTRVSWDDQPISHIVCLDRSLRTSYIEQNLCPVALLPFQLATKMLHRAHNEPWDIFMKVRYHGDASYFLAK